MKVLYVTGSCLTRNTSANMSHNAFIQGLLENGCEVDILMASESWGEQDKGLPTWTNARYYCYNSISAADRLRYLLRGKVPQSTKKTAGDSVTKDPRKTVKSRARTLGKLLFYTLFPNDPFYPLEKEWLKKASRFCADEKYDLVVSNSSPAASHRLVVELKKKDNLRFDRWIQIWEDPWYHDLYGGHPAAVEEEEHSLLRAASEIVYVSPLTMMYQKRYFPDCAEKMRCVPLPALALKEGEPKPNWSEYHSVGYFGDYFSATRDLRPFYSALKQSEFRGYIYGDSDIALPSSDCIEVSGRVTLDKLQAIQAKTDILVHLSNLRGGQIPGKIFHYSVTNKPILFILDGTEEEQHALIKFFKPFHRYVFCKNNQEEIFAALIKIAGRHSLCRPVTAFFPKQVVKELISGRDEPYV